MSAAIAMLAPARPVAKADVVRRVYFSARDDKGAAVTDLTQADLAVKEGGKDRAILAVEPASAPVQVMLLVDDGGTGAFQGAVAQFLQTMIGRGHFAIRALNPQPARLTDFTENPADLRTALNGIGARGRVTSIGEQIIEAVAEAAKELQQRKAPRPVIVVLTVVGEQLHSDQADSSLNALKNSGASLSVVHLAAIQLGPVLGDGPKRSGGMMQQISAGVVPGAVLQPIADTLLHQYVLTYTLPDGVKPNERFSLTTSRKGLTLLAPSRLPDK
jgi:membrane-associated protease RseP (regulator of RpoE activity)